MHIGLKHTQGWAQVASIGGGSRVWLHLLELYAEAIARAKLLLEVQPTSQAAQPASGHDCNAVTCITPGNPQPPASYRQCASLLGRDRTLERHERMKCMNALNASLIMPNVLAVAALVSGSSSK